MTIKLESKKGRGFLRGLKNPLYDTEHLVHNTATQELRFFQKPQGIPIVGGGADKSEADTNLKQSGKIPKPQEFEVHGIQCDITLDDNGISDAANIVANKHDIYERGLFKFFIGTQTSRLKCPLENIPEGARLSGCVATADDTNNPSYSLAGNGLASSKEMFRYAIGNEKETIGWGETFSAKISWPAAITITTTGTNQYRICVYLKGILAKEL